MAYLSAYRGDYMGGYGARGDPGLGSFFKGLVKRVRGVARTVSQFIPGPGGAIARMALGGRPPRSISEVILPPVVRPGAGTVFPGGGMGMEVEQFRGVRGSVQLDASGQPVRRRRRMNVTNPKALRRAIRRTDGFVKLARRALKGTGYTVARRGSRGRRISVKESGSGSVTVQ